MPLRTRINGFTLIELIVFVVVAALFIPTAYIAFMAVARRAAQPEALVRARFLAETKVEDLTGVSYSAIPVPPSGYSDVRNDSRFRDANMPSPNPYAGYQWKWTYSSVAYSDTPPHDNPVFCAVTSHPSLPQCDAWRVSTVYKIGDYVKPSGSTPALLYRCIPRVKWEPSISYPVGSLAWPVTPSGFCYRSSAPTWQPSHAYAVGQFVEPTTPNGHSYRCHSIVGGGISGTSAPAWPTSSGAVVTDGDITWMEAQPVSGSTEPTWPRVVGETVDDGNVRWVTEPFPVMRSGGAEPIWPTHAGERVDDGDLRWQESTVYKHITVYVLEPKGYEYIVNTVVTARPGAYP